MPSMTASLMRWVCVGAFGATAPPPGRAEERIGRAGEERNVLVVGAGLAGNLRKGRGHAELVVRALLAEAREQQATVDIGADQVAIRRTDRGADEKGGALVVVIGRSLQHLLID